MNIAFYLLYASWYLPSLLPLQVLYFFADLLYYPLYHCIRYRRRIVRKNLVGSFPEKDIKEIVRIEKRFYHFFCDYLMETVKLTSISRKQLMRRMTFDGIDDLLRDMEANHSALGFVYLGHFCNWEWIASLGYWAPAEVHCAQIYHPLRNKTFDRLLLKVRNRFGGESIPMKITLRRMVEQQEAQQKTFIGFIADQLPKWSSIHHFSPFLRRETAFFTGTEQIGKRLGAVIYYGEVTRPRRGTYHCSMKRLTDRPAELKDFKITDLYAAKLEEMIRNTPHLWLWSHDRWKRTKEEYDRRMLQK